jgi:signal transduction histidine kinase
LVFWFKMSSKIVSFLVLRLLAALCLALAPVYNIYSQDKSDSLYYEKYKALRTKNLDSALFVVQKGIKSTNQSSLLNIKFHNALGWIYGQKNDRSSSIHYLKKGLALAQEQQNEEWITHLSNVIGVTYQELSNLDSALHYFLITIGSAKKQRSAIDLGIGLCNIGYTYYKLDAINEAIPYLERSIVELSELPDGKEFLVASTINLALCYSRKGNIDQTGTLFNNAEKICAQYPDICSDKMKLDINYNLGIVLFNKKELGQSESKLLESYDQAKKIPALLPLSTITFYLAKIAEASSDFDKALSFLDESEGYAVEIQSLERRKNNAGLWADIYEKTNRYEKSIEKRKVYETLKDSIFREELVSTLKEVSIQEQKDIADIVISKKDSEISNRTTILYLLAAVLVLTGLVLYFVYARYKIKNNYSHLLEATVEKRTLQLVNSNEQLTASRKDLDNFIYRLSHNIRGPLATLLGLTNIARADVKDPVAKDLITKIDNTASRLNDILTQLIIINNLLNSPLQPSEVTISQLVVKARFDNKNLDAFPIIKWNSSFEESANQVTSDRDCLQLIFNQLINNCYRYFNENSQSPYISVSAKDLSDGSIQVTIEENGIGIEESVKDLVFDVFYIGNEKGGFGLGLFHAKLAAERIGVKIDVVSIKSPTIFRVIIPKKLATESES